MIMGKVHSHMRMRWCYKGLFCVDTPEELFEAYTVIVAEHSQRCYRYTVLSRLDATYVQFAQVITDIILCQSSLFSDLFQAVHYPLVEDFIAS